jgi:hypothetical protein
MTTPTNGVGRRVGRVMISYVNLSKIGIITFYYN